MSNKKYKIEINFSKTVGLDKALSPSYRKIYKAYEYHMFDTYIKIHTNKDLDKPIIVPFSNVLEIEI